MHDPNPMQIAPPEFGYFLHPPRRRTEPGHACLEIYLREQPSYHHFDPDQVNLTVASPDAGTENLKLSHPWLGLCRWRVCAGQVDLLDRKNKHVDLFSFGGELLIEKIDDQNTHVILKSPAPILVSQVHTSTANLLIQEIEIQMAQLRAEWLQEQENFDICLAGIEPFDLYRMCLAVILERLGQLPYHDEGAAKLKLVCQEELAAIGFPAMTLADLKG